MSEAEEAVLSVQSLCKSYRRRGKSPPVQAVDDVSFSLGPGEIVGLLGPNGAGKTTTIKCVCQLIRPSSGRILINGIDTAVEPRRAVRHLAATLEGSRNLDYRMTARENLELFAALHGISRRKCRDDVERLLALFRLEHKGDEVAQTLSRGMLQRLAVACCLVKRPTVVLLDEPTLGLDIESAHELRALLKRMSQEYGTTILISSHDMGTVSDVCSRGLVMRDARLVADTPLDELIDRFALDEYLIHVTSDRVDHTRSALEKQGYQVDLIAEPHRLRLRIPRRDEQLAAALDAIRHGDAMLESVVTHRPDLEQVLLRLNG
jgi:ABC-2 type transport system ATP-binding protein